jgi:DNA-binding transcriptional ArsR family regulator
LGRRTLVERTGITESTVRTHLTKLRRAGLVRMAKAGTLLTARGLEAFAPLFENVRWTGSLSLSELALDRHNAAALLTDTAEEFKESWRYRDAAVREGATGALLLVKRPQGWAFSDEPLKLAERYPEDAAQIEKALPQAEPGDALVVAFGSEPREAQDGLWRVIVELFPPSTLKHPEHGG